MNNTVKKIHFFYGMLIIMNNSRTYLKICLFLFCYIVFFSCETSSENNDINTQASQTQIEFDNLEQHPVIIYTDPSRLIYFTQVDGLSQRIVTSYPAPHGKAFYPTFIYSFKVGTNDIFIPFNGQTIIAAIEENKTNLIKIPKHDGVEINNAYIFIINDSDFSLSFREGNLEKPPIGRDSSIINSGNSGAYEISPGNISGYSIRKNTTDPIAFPSSLTEFRQGVIYEITYTNTGLELTKETDVVSSGSNIKWSNDINGTLNINNKSSKDMVLFLGNLNTNNLIGGVRSGVKKNFNISSKVYDFQVGGSAVIYGISNDEFNSRIDNLSSAKIEYSAMIIFGQGKIFETEITNISMGNYMYRVSNTTKYGLELRKNSPDGEKVAYIPPLVVNFPIYAGSTEPIVLYSVYIIYNKVIDIFYTFIPTDIFNRSITVSPKAINSGQVSTYVFSDIPVSIFVPYSIFDITNNSNQNCTVTLSNNILTSESGLIMINPNSTQRYVIEGAKLPDGTYSQETTQNIILQFLGGTVSIPVRFTGDTLPPVIKIGHRYTVTVTGNGTNADNYNLTLIDNGSILIDQILGM